ncbi:MAG: hypothetical protein ACLUT1_08335 [Ruminococcus sp.]
MYSFIIQDFIAFGKWNKKTKKQPANRTKNADTNAFWCSNFSKMLPQSLRRGVSYFCAAKIKTKHLHKKRKRRARKQKKHFAYSKKTKRTQYVSEKKECFHNADTQSRKMRLLGKQRSVFAGLPQGSILSIGSFSSFKIASF